jgi:hypothetical protein
MAYGVRTAYGGQDGAMSYARGREVRARGCGFKSEAAVAPPVHLFSRADSITH